MRLLLRTLGWDSFDFFLMWRRETMVVMIGHGALCRLLPSSFNGGVCTDRGSLDPFVKRTATTVQKCGQLRS
jgi:hypothetical protein